MEQNQVPQLEIVNTGMNKKIMVLLGIFGVLLIAVAVVVYLQYQATKEINSDIIQINNNNKIGIGST